jgi:hypothetical protein
MTSRFGGWTAERSRAEVLSAVTMHDDLIGLDHVAGFSIRVRGVFRNDTPLKLVGSYCVKYLYDGLFPNEALGL